MPITDHSSDTTLPHQIFHGTTWHSRLLPSVHKFAYPYRYWGVNISALATGSELPEVNASILNESKVLKKLPLNNSLLNSALKGLPLFSVKHRALQQFYADDYLQQSVEGDDNADDNDNTDVSSPTDNNTGSINDIQALEQRLSQAFIKHTGSVPTGEMIGMVVCRNVGVYFSPVNFYLGFDSDQTPTHLLAEVSNTPWNKRYYYGILLDGAETEFCHDKNLHVSPFNPVDQLYRWQVSIKNKAKNQADNGLQVRIAINVSDERGEVLKTGIKMSSLPMTAENVQKSLKQNPLMNITSLTRIYWQAFKLYAIKKVPYINYDEKLADSQQQKEH